MDVWFHARVVVNAKIEWDISLLVEIVFCCLFIFMPFSLKEKSLQSLNATRWCEYSASDRRAWTAEVKCTHPHTFLCTSAHTYTSTFSSVVLPTDFPSSCKNSAVFGEINALVLLMQSRTHRRVVEHLWRNSRVADHQHPYSVNLNQAVTRRKRFTTCVPSHKTQMGLCKPICLLNLQSYQGFWWQFCGWRFKKKKKVHWPVLPLVSGKLYSYLSISNVCLLQGYTSTLPTSIRRTGAFRHRGKQAFKTRLEDVFRSLKERLALPQCKNTSKTPAFTILLQKMYR